MVNGIGVEELGVSSPSGLSGSIDLQSKAMLPYINGDIIREEAAWDASK